MRTIFGVVTMVACVAVGAHAGYDVLVGVTVTG